MSWEIIKQGERKGLEGINQVTLLGNVGINIEYKEENGEMLKFSMATNEFITTESGLMKRTEWHDVVCFGVLSKRVRDEIKKGSRVFVSGALTKRTLKSEEGYESTRVQVEAKHILIKPKQEDQEPKEDQRIKELREELERLKNTHSETNKPENPQEEIPPEEDIPQDMLKILTEQGPPDENGIVYQEEPDVNEPWFDEEELQENKEEERLHDPFH